MKQRWDGQQESSGSGRHQAGGREGAQWGEGEGEDSLRTKGLRGQATGVSALQRPCKGRGTVPGWVIANRECCKQSPYRLNEKSEQVSHLQARLLPNN